MGINLKEDAIHGDSSIKILDFDIDSSGINLFTTNCKVVESKQQTYTIGNCTTVDCTTVQCTTVQCTTVKCTTINCTTVNCTTVTYSNCQCNCNDN